MATLKTNLIEPEGATTTLIVGEAGGDLVIGADSLKANVAKSQTNIVTDEFISTGAATWTCPAGVTTAEVLVVGGGGSGGSNGGGGAGGGGIVHATEYTVVPAVVYDITVGVGQARTTGTAVGVNGGDSVWNVNAEGSGIALTAKGGGGGASNVAGEHAGNAGGSGGGANWQNTTEGESNQADFAGATSYGNQAGESFEQGSPAYWYSGGGGGAAAAGSNAAVSTPSHGGAGKSFSISGLANYFGAGGGGGTNGSPWTAGDGGQGGGGAGSETGQGGDGWSYGSGGGGGGTTNGGGGAGKQGAVYVKYTVATPQTMFVSNGSGTVSSVNAGWGGVQVLLSSQTASNSASISFTSGIDSTYEEYIFEFININPATDSTELRLNASTDGGSSYGITKTTTYFRAYHYEDESSYHTPASGPTYDTGSDLAQSTSPQILVTNIHNAADATACGELHLFNPSSTTYVKNFYSEISNMIHWPGNDHVFVGGYLNTTSAIDAVKFDVDSGTFDGTIKMYGIK